MSEPFVGELRLFGFSFAPRGWAFCAGQVMSIAQNNALFSLLGTTYGGNGQTTFALPDLRGRVPVGQGQGPGLSSYVLGEPGGAEGVTLLTSQMPAHSHTASLAASTGDASTKSPNGNYLAATAAPIYSPSPTSAALNGLTVGLTGSSLPHENRQPFLTLNWCIALEGIFPSRN